VLVDKRLWRWFVAPVLVLTAATVLSPVAAHASGHVIEAYTTTMINVDPTTGEISSSDPAWRKQGYCTLYPATVVLSPPDENGNAWVALHATAFTIRTSDGPDTWRTGIQLFDAYGNDITSQMAMDGPLMTQVFTPYGWDFYQPMQMSWDTFASITYVGWSVRDC
jgi:hypothetical protein